MVTYTPYLRLSKPPFDSVPWDQQINGDMDIIDGFIAQFMSVPNFSGAWTNSTSYIAGQIALDTSTSSMWRCDVSHTSAAAPTTFAQDRIAHPGYWDNTTVAQGYLPISGGIMTGPLTLWGAPTAPLHAATKQYADGTGVTSFNSRIGAVTLGWTDVTNALGYAPYNPASGSYVAKTGDTMTGSLGISPSSGAAQISLQHVAGQSAQIAGYNGTSPRWLLQIGDASPESGGNAGSHFTITRFTDAGVVVDSPFTINRQNGNTAVQNLFASNVSSSSYSTTGNVSIGGGITTINGDAGFTLQKFTGMPTLQFAFSQYIQYDGTNLNYALSAGTHIFNRSINSASNVIASAASYFGYGTYQGFYCTTDATYDYMIFTTDQWSMRFNRSNHSWDWCNQSALVLAHLDGAGNWSTFGTQTPSVSDERTKRNVLPYTRGLADVIALEPVTFYFNGEGGTQDNGVMHTGLIAQQAQPYIPEMIYEVPEPEYRLGPDDPQPEPMRLPGQLGINDEALIYALINAIKELTARVTALETASVSQ